MLEQQQRPPPPGLDQAQAIRRAVQSVIASSTSSALSSIPTTASSSSFVRLPQHWSSGAVALLARQGATATAATTDAASRSSATIGYNPRPYSIHSSAEREVVQSEIHTMSIDQLLGFDNTSSLTISAIIAVIGALGGVMILCIILGAILSKTNRPQQEAFPYAQLPGQQQSGMYQPSASVLRHSVTNSSAYDYEGKYVLDLAAPVAGGSVGDSQAHSRTGSSGIGFPGPLPASRRTRPTVAQYSDRPSPGSTQPPLPPSGIASSAPPGAVNYNGREMTINMAGPQADQTARVAAEQRLNRELSRRSTVYGGPPPMSNNKRASRYSRTSIPPPSSRLSGAATKAQQRMSRVRSSRLFATDSLNGDKRSIRRSVTSTSPGMPRSPSQRWEQAHYSGDRRGTAGPFQYSSERSSTISAESIDPPSLYDVGHTRSWNSTGPASHDNLLDPLQANHPNPFSSPRR